MELKKHKFTTLFVLSIVIATVAASLGIAGPDTNAICGKRIAMIIAYTDFQNTEFEVPKTLFEKEGGIVKTVSTQLGMATAMKGAKVKTDILIDELRTGEFDAFVFIGGKGVAEEYWENPKAHAIVREAGKQGKTLAAICWAPMVLANAGVLKGKQATMWVGGDEADVLKEKGCIYTAEKVTRDGNIITANGPSAAEAFAIAVIKSLMAP